MTSMPLAAGPGEGHAEEFPRSTPEQQAKVLYLHLWLMTIACVAGFGFRLHERDTLAALRVASLLLVFVTGWAAGSWIYLTTRKLSAYALWILSCFAFHGGQTLLFLFGWMPFGLFEQSVPVDLQIRSTCFAALCLAFAHLGALVALVRHGSRPVTEDRYPEPQDLRWVGWALLACSAPGWLLMMARLLPSLFSFGYRASSQTITGLASAPVLLSVLCIPGAMLLVATGAERPLQRRVAASVLLINAVVWLVIGSRAEAVTPVLGLAWLWERRIHVLPRIPIVAVAGVMFLFVLPVVAVIRGLPISERASVSSILSFARQLPEQYNPALFIFQELGRTQRVLAYTMESVPDYLPYDYGVTYLTDLTLVMPNLFWDRHPAASLPNLAEEMSKRFEPLKSALGFGMGGTLIGEAYWSFGWFGAVVPFMLIGYGFSWLLVWADRSRNVGASAAVAAFLGYWLFAPRSHFAQVVRPLFWHAMMPYIAAVMLGRFRKIHGQNRETAGEGIC